MEKRKIKQKTENLENKIILQITEKVSSTDIREMKCYKVEGDYESFSLGYNRYGAQIGNLTIEAGTTPIWLTSFIYRAQFYSRIYTDDKLINEFSSDDCEKNSKNLYDQLSKRYKEFEKEEQKLIDSKSRAKEIKKLQKLKRLLK